ncbi:MAG: helix-turn-helix transcriptional regulator, partial [Thermoleophilaceae bacterium]|nr:helix-turn-helix transcriptional regulator [Thermoleophilaceae bacterium]
MATSVGTEEIVRQANVRRGALYHHFSDKRDLFRAVHNQVEEDMVAKISEAMAGIDDPVE